MRRSKKLLRVWLLGVLSLVLAGIAVPSTEAAAAASPATECTVTSSANGALRIEWQPAAGAVAYVVYRRVDGSAPFWRGRTATVGFDDTDRFGSLAYSVVAVSAANERATATPCRDDRPIVVPATPASCVVRPSAAGRLSIAWTPVSGATDYIVSRSVDGSASFWRGRTNGTTFDDADRTAHLEYSVVARSADGQRSAPAPCSDERLPQAFAPATCQIVRTGPATLDVRWSAASNAANYIVSRSVDGGGRFWRGRTSGLHLSDDDRIGSNYFVVAVSSTGQRSGLRPCASEVAEPGTINVVAVGDMVDCNGGGAQRVSDLLEKLPGRILGLGDFAYESGSAVEFENCFDPIFGGQRARFAPVPGNHEYVTPGAEPYFAYFGAAAGEPTKGYYAMNVGNWHILGLNSNCGEVGGCTDSSPQGLWLSDQLATAPAGVCRIAFLHHPRYSSYDQYDDALFLQPLHQQLFEAGTDLVITGHAHHYERFTPMQADGSIDLARGITNLTVGTGGLPLRRNLTPRAESAVRITDRWGVLDLDLRDTDYSWRFVDVDGHVLDSGTETCISAR